MPLPALRELEIFPIEHEGKIYLCLNDPTYIAEERLLLTPPAMFVASLLNGETEVEDIQHTFESQFKGATLPETFIYDVVGHLDRECFLYTDRFWERRRGIAAAYQESPVRPAFLAGKSYPADPEELRHFLDSQFARSGAPGPLNRTKQNGSAPLSGLVVPHIDFHRGGASYAHGYRRLYESGTPDTVVVFGVAHQAEPVPFIFTRKHFETPLGVVETDTELVATLTDACDWDPYAYELTHRTEHSVEFQAVMLAHLYGPRVRIVPILCSYFMDGTPSADPSEIDAIERFLEVCRKVFAESGKRVTVLAAADLAHVGRRFGDDWDVDDDVIRDVAARDEEDLAFVSEPQPAAFYRSVCKDLNARRVCGLNCIYAAMKCLEGRVSGGERVHYDYAHDPAGGIVSFASMVFR